MLFELEGEPERVVRAGEVFWEPGGDVIHYQDGNNRDDIPLRFTVTMLCEPGKPMLALVDDEELAQRQDRRAPARPELGRRYELGLVEQPQPAPVRLAPDDLRPGAGPVLRRGRGEGDVAADQRRQRLFRLEVGARRPAPSPTARGSPPGPPSGSPGG